MTQWYGTAIRSAAEKSFLGAIYMMKGITAIYVNILGRKICIIHPHLYIQVAYARFNKYRIIWCDDRIVEKLTVELARVGKLARINTLIGPAHIEAGA